MRALAALAIALALAGCTRTVTVRQPVPVEIVRQVYVPIPAALTAPHEIAEGAPSQCLHIAIARAEALDRCNVDKANIARIQGTRVQEGDE